MASGFQLSFYTILLNPLSTQHLLPPHAISLSSREKKKPIKAAWIYTLTQLKTKVLAVNFISVFKCNTPGSYHAIITYITISSNVTLCLKARFCQIQSQIQIDMICNLNSHNFLFHFQLAVNENPVYPALFNHCFFLCSNYWLITTPLLIKYVLIQMSTIIQLLCQDMAEAIIKGCMFII